MTATPLRPVDMRRWTEDLFELVQASRTLEDFRMGVLTALRAETRASSGMYLPGPPLASVDGRSLRVLKPLFLDHPHEGVMRFLNGPQPFRDELAALGQAQRRGVPLSDREIFPSDVRLQMRSYRELFEADGVGSFITIPLIFQGAQIGAYLVSRWLDAPLLDAADAARLVPLMPLLVMTDRLKAHEARSPTGLAGPELAASGLTAREKQVAELASSGLQNKTIAETLGLSPNTVRNVLAQVFDKLSVQTRTQLAYKLLEQQPHG